MNGPRPDVAVVGGGFSGLLTALHLLSQPDGPRVHLIERGARFGAGGAYAPHHAEHMLNVRAGNMSAFPDQPAHFVDWLRGQGRDGDPAAFVSRAVYGAYLNDLLRRAATRGEAAGRLVLIGDRVVGLDRRDAGIDVHLAMGRTLPTRAAVLALGVGPPLWPAVLKDVPAAWRVDDPWAEGATDGIDPSRPVLVLGSGLTMVDVACRLIDAGHAGPIVALSRRGLSPHSHAGPPTLRDAPRLSGPLSAMLRRLRLQAAETEDWRPLFDSLRPHTDRLWNGLSLSDRARFLQRLRPYWDIHRHRLAPAVHQRLTRWRAEGRLSVLAGRIISAEPVAEGLNVRYRPRGGREALAFEVGAVVNATGPGADIERSRDPLLVQLRADGLIRPDAMRLGLDVNARGEVRDAEGRSDGRLTAIGPLTRGRFWEAGAVPDLRNHALALARHVNSGLAAGDLL